MQNKASKQKYNMVAVHEAIERLVSGGRLRAIDYIIIEYVVGEKRKEGLMQNKSRVVKPEGGGKPRFVIIDLESGFDALSAVKLYCEFLRTYGEESSNKLADEIMAAVKENVEFFATGMQAMSLLTPTENLPSRPELQTLATGTNPFDSDDPFK